MDQQKTNSRLLVITGPTSVGKSAVAFCIASQIDAEIVSADSMQVYKGMNIGTAKPSAAEMRRIPHHLVNIIQPDQEFSVALYQTRARKVIHDIQDRGRLPVLTGGSGLYIRAAVDKLEFPIGALSTRVRSHLEARLQAVGSAVLYQELRSVDPEAAKKIHPGNERRLLRALEVIELTGRPFSVFQKEWMTRKSIYNLRMIALNLPRSELYAKIDARVDKMIGDGLIEEVRALIERGFGATVTSKQALGYRQVLDYLENRISLDECIESIKRSTRNFAKRQLTWLRQDPRIVWMERTGLSAEEAAAKILDYLAVEGFCE